MTDSKDIALKAAGILDSKKARDVIVINISGKSSFADYFVIASGGSERQIGTLKDDVEDAFAKDGMFAKNVEGRKTSGWILMDFGDVIVNIMTEEMRSRYNIEKVWGDCDFIHYEDGTENEREI